MKSQTYNYKNEDYHFSHKLGFFILKKSQKERTINLGDYASLVPDNYPVPKVNKRMVMAYINLLFSQKFNPVTERKELMEEMIEQEGMVYEQVQTIRYQLDNYAKHFGLVEYLKNKRWEGNR